MSKKHINYLAHPFISADISIFHRKWANFVISRNTEIDCILINSFYFFFGLFKDFFIKKGCNFDDVSKIGPLCLCKIKLFRNKSYDVETSDHGATNKILSRGSNYIIDVTIWPKIGKYNILKRKVIIIRSALLRKIQFFDECFWFRFNNLGLALGTTLKISSLRQMG